MHLFAFLFVWVADWVNFDLVIYRQKGIQMQKVKVSKKLFIVYMVYNLIF